MMQDIFIKRYNPDMQSKAKWAGVIEPQDRAWIVFVDVDNVPHLFLHRDISVAEALERGFAPKDPETQHGIDGEYVAAELMPKGERPTPNLPAAVA